MKEQIKGILIILGVLAVFYGIGCLIEYISNTIIMETLSKLIYIFGAITIIVLSRKEKKNA